MHAKLVERILFVFFLGPAFHYIRFELLLKVSCVAGTLLFLRWLRNKRKSVFNMGGYVAPGWEHVADVYKKNLLSGQDQGSSFAVYHEGEPVVDLWGGYADSGSLHLRNEFSIGLFYSATKAVTAICLAVCADRGLLKYEEKVSKYWPEFAENGKEDITVATLVSHQGGLSAVTDAHKLQMCLDDPDQLGQILARQQPLFKPNTGLAYHTLTLGLYVDQIIRRVDVKGRSLADFFHQEIANKFDMEFYIGQPNHLHHRACRETRADFGLVWLLTRLVPVGLTWLIKMAWCTVRYRTMYIRHLIGNPSDWRPRRLNDPKFRALPCGSSHGFGTSRALAKLMGILSNGGEDEGKKILSPEMIEYLNTPLVTAFDRVILRELTYGPGTVLMTAREPNKKDRHIFGHWGAGGQMAYSDPAYQLGWAYNTNYSNILHGAISDHRYQDLEDAMYACLTQLKHSQHSR